MDDIADLVNAERRELADLLDGLDAGQWLAPSLCAGWRVREVVAHLLMPYEMSGPRLLALVATHRFDFDRVADLAARRDRRTADELLAALRATARKRFPRPGGPTAPLVHLMIHGEDIRHPLGLTRTVPGARATIALDQLVSPAARRFVRPGLLDGLAYVSTDTDWRHGTGAEVAGSSGALITTLAGRRAAVDELSGAGVARVREVLGSADRSRS